MNDHLGLFDRADDTGNVDLDELRAALARSTGDAPPDGRRAARASVPEQRPGGSARQDQRARREALLRRRRRRRRHTLLAVVVLAVLAAAITTGIVLWRHNAGRVADFSGAPGPQVFVRVQSGDTREDVAAALQQAGVVASTEAFLDATTNDGDVQKVKPGYYRLPTALPASAAADALVDPQNRVGQLRIVPGRQLADIRTGAAAASTTSSGGATASTPAGGTTGGTAPSGGATPSGTGGAAGTGGTAGTVEGYISAITQAACVPLNGSSRCWTAQDLWQVERTADPVALGVPDWAVAAVQAAPDPSRRLEGLIVPGDYDVPPGSTPQQALQAVIGGSAANWNTSSLVAKAKSIGVTPYQAVTIASLVEREGTAATMADVARVLYNRIQVRMPLQLDSTVVYALDKARIATTAAERRNPSPYNTYLHSGLPPTPISSPGQQAVDGTLDPGDGDWLYFVLVDRKGDVCFSVTYAEHSACVAQARRNGVFDE
ncbi:endolytic transglycosylase MltG [Nakamurella endophytica]|uniref:Endolytic murein transglycosylase n=1 Tax=Nakamurella endophytica TaxID=1748367 RepID=A0A917TCH7_9ACTN|nr:endolytic transglycosylase MltG [Nakamurella endophytica]GGM17605.1 ABC transporter substrate-binding protein [Nakamurella endophytica]